MSAVALFASPGQPGWLFAGMSCRRQSALSHWNRTVTVRVSYCWPRGRSGSLIAGGALTVAALNLESGAGVRFFAEFMAVDGTRRLEPLTACVTERLENAAAVCQWWGLAADVAVTVAVSSAQVVRWQADPDHRAPGPRTGSGAAA